MPEMILQSKYSRFCLEAVSHERLNANGSATRYFLDKKYTAYYCFKSTLPLNTNNSILKLCAKWSVFP